MGLLGTLGTVVPNLPHDSPPNDCPRPEYQFSGHGTYQQDTYNSGGNSNGSGMQKNGDVKVRYQSPTTGLLNVGSLLSNKDNMGSQQLLGDVNVANIGQ